MLTFKKIFIAILLIFSTSIINGQKKYFTWTKYPKLINQLDSFILNCHTYALNPTDYNHKYLKEYLLKTKVAINDSSKFDSTIHKIALHFYSDLCFGNKMPSLQYVRKKISFDVNDVNQLLINNAKSQTLRLLIEQYNSQSNEIFKILGELNKKLTSLSNQRKKNLFQAANYYRWLFHFKKSNKLILVNIPSTHLTFYENGKQVLDMKVIVGKGLTPTVSLQSVLNQIIINPYWNVPRSIMVREMLPHLKNDPEYIDRNHFQLLDLNYKIINPYNINWGNIDTINFPYYIRQSTGCDNSLGVIKLDFDNPFGIYIHDTPEKSLFNFERRFYSHGCIRMEKPIEMAKILLKNNKQALDSIDFENCYKNPTPINIQIKEIVNVVIWYNLIDFDQQGNIQYNSDIYHKYKY